MSRYALVTCALALLAAAPAAGQAPQFRADVERTGDEPFTGTMYFGGERMRIEGTSDGEEVTLIIDASANSILVVMPEDRTYMTMDLGSAPFSAPGAQPMDPSNPCGTGEVTDCTNLGTETVNGYAARGWEYTMDGERVTSWIATEVGFPVRTIEADGATTDITNVAMGPQPASLFEPPAGYTAMDMSAMLGGRGRGRGVPPGVATGQGRGAARGQVPPGAIPPGARGRGAAAGGAAPAGVDPAAAAQLTAQLQAMGLPPDQIAAAIAQLGALAATQGTDYSAWEQVGAWVVDFSVTASGSDTQTFEGGGTLTARYSASYTASVPITYGTPGVGAQLGPAWQLVPSLESERLPEPLTLSGTTEYHSEMTQPANCPGDAGFRRIVEASGSGQMSMSENSMQIQGSARFETTGDLRTFSLMAGAGTSAPETTTTTTTYNQPCPPESPSETTETTTSEQSHSPGFNLTGLPLAASPGPMSGTSTMPLRFNIGPFDGELDATVEWTLRPIS